MRALHVFPTFGADLTSGSEYYEYMLTKTLIEQGVEVDVLTTTSRRVQPRSAFSSGWSHDYASGRECAPDGITIHRAPVSFSMPTALGDAVSRVMFRRWRLEERRYGCMMRGSVHRVDHFHRRALSRPALYDGLMLLARGPNSIRLLMMAAALMRPCDVVLVGFLPFALVWQITRLARMLGKPVVVLPLFHPDDVYHHFAAHYRALARADAVLAQTAYTADLLKRLIPAANPVEVGAGVDDVTFGQAGCGERFRDKYGLHGKKIVLFVGRKEPSKRYDLAVEAIDLIDDERIKLVMIGRDVDARPVTSTNTLYLGPLARGDLHDAYEACEVLVLPSEHESFGIVFLEAWMRRKPVIGNRACAPVASVIRDGRDGYLCSDGEEFAGKIVTLICNSSLAAALGNAGHERVMARHTWTAVARKVGNVYADVCRTRSRTAAPRGDSRSPADSARLRNRSS
jgi:glycosyltransferase involved in cell wall biosynthesis